ncbi:MAG: mevalonate kinase [Promethearchaeota archaeon]
MKRVTAIAPGKCILFGEHAVVYGYPAIAMAINKSSICTIEQIKDNKILISLKDFHKHYEFSNYNDLITNFPEDIHNIAYALMNLTENYMISINNISITLSSSLISSSGLGSSASIAVSLVAALSGFYELKIDKEMFSQIAYEMEKIHHGKPSGIDNIVCTFGNLLYFKNRQFTFLNYPKNLNILISYSNIQHSTHKAINKIKNLKENNPKLINSIFKKIGKISDAALLELKKENLKKLGFLMNKNQDLLSKLEISNEVIDKIINISLDNGAYGSKLTGAGLGGCVISLGNKEALLRISNLLKTKSYKSFLTTTHQEGVKLEGVW